MLNGDVVRTGLKDTVVTDVLFLNFLYIPERVPKNDRRGEENYDSLYLIHRYFRLFL